MTTTAKRGDTFIMEGPILINGAVMDLTGWTVRSQVRKDEPTAALGTNTLIQELTASVIDGPTATISAKALKTQTANWPLCPAVMDIQLTDPEGNTTSTPPIYFTIVAGVTHD